MDTLEINKKLQKIISFHGTFPCDKIPLSSNKISSFIVNTANSKSNGEHWVAIFIHKEGKGEYFDPFGLPPMNKYIIKYLDCNSPSGWIYNNIPLQDPETKLCGQYCIAYIKAKQINKSLKQFLLLNAKHIY